MEADRYNQNHRLYILGMICFLASMGCFLFFLFTFPHLIMGWRYDVPEFIAFWRQYLVVSYNMTEGYASGSISFFFLVLTLLFGYGAYYCSTRIENALYHIEEKSNLTVSQGMKESFYVFLKIAGLIVLLLVLMILIQWLIYIPAVNL